MVSKVSLIVLTPALLTKREGLLRGCQMTVDSTIGLQCVTFQSLNTHHA
jgi:hypothetical protein